MKKAISLAIVFVFLFIASSPVFAQNKKTSAWDRKANDSDSYSYSGKTAGEVSAKNTTAAKKNFNPATVKALGRMTKTLSDAKKAKEAKSSASTSQRGTEYSPSKWSR